MYYRIEDNLLHTHIGAYNFFSLLLCWTINVYEKSDVVETCVTAQLPNHAYARWSSFTDEHIEEISEVFENEYDSVTNARNASTTLKRLLSLDVDENKIVRCHCGYRGVAVIILMDNGNYTSIEVSKRYSIYENL